VLEEVLHDKRAVGVCAEIECMGHDVVNEARKQCLREMFQHSLADSATKTMFGGKYRAALTLNF